MVKILYTIDAQQQIDDIITDSRIYLGKSFTQEFINWNREFHHYVNARAISKVKLFQHGIYKIGDIGTLIYNHYTLNDADIFEILSFRFSKRPYSTKKYKIVGDGGYRYKIIQSTFNYKYTLLTPKNRFLTKFAFDGIIGFHHSSNDYNVLYAIGFIGDRVYAIYPDRNIQLLQCSKEEYLKMKHKYYESLMRRRIILSESRLNRIIRESIRRVVGF